MPSEDGLPEAPKPPLVPTKLIVFTVNLVGGLVLSQLLPSALGESAHHVWSEVVAVFTMTCLSFIMINVGYEFDIDKAHVSKYVGDYLIGEGNSGGLFWEFPERNRAFRNERAQSFSIL